MPSATLTVLSWNLFLGSGAPANFWDHLRRHWNVFFFERGPRWAIEPLVELVEREHCDVVCLQEVDGGSWRNGYRDLVAEISERAGLAHYRFAPQRRRHCNDGIALLSRHPLIDVKELVLDHDFEQRGLILAKIAKEEHELTVAVTHLAALPFNGALRRRQTEHIARELEPGARLILAADFNCDPEAPELAPLKTQLGLRPLISAPSFPAYRPRQRLDNVFASRQVDVTDARVLSVRHSDHLPVLVRIVL